MINNTAVTLRDLRTEYYLLRCDDDDDDAAQSGEEKHARTHARTRAHSNTHTRTHARTHAHTHAHTHTDWCITCTKVKMQAARTKAVATRTRMVDAKVIGNPSCYGSQRVIVQCS